MELRLPTRAATRRRTHRSLWVSLTLFIVCLVFAGGAPGQEKSLLWRVSRDGSSIHVLGSIHYLRQEHYPLNPAIRNALETSKRLVLEIDLIDSEKVPI